MTYIQLLNQTINNLKQNNLNDEVAFDLLFALDEKIKNKLDFLKYRNEKIENKVFFKDYLTKINEFIIDKKPLSRILGFDYFHNNQFYIFNNVFAFRKETELVLDWSIKLTKDFEWISNVLDACCGTGVLGLSYKIYNPSKAVDLIDINPDAVKNTLYNQKINKVKEVNVFNDSIFNFILNSTKKYDLLLCNPPYIKKSFVLEKQVTHYDPLNALYDFSDVDGIGFYIFLLKNIEKYMNKKYFLIFEIGFDQHMVLKNFLDNNHFNNYLFIKDYNNLWRYLIVSSEGLWKYIDYQN